MTKNEIGVIEGLLSQEGVAGKDYLRRFLWLNTTSPKYNVGDCFYVTCRGQRVYGVPVKDFKARIVKVASPSKLVKADELQYGYELVARVKNSDDRETDVTIYKDEGELTRKAVDNMNILYGDSEQEEEIQI